MDLGFEILKTFESIWTNVIFLWSDICFLLTMYPCPMTTVFTGGLCEVVHWNSLGTIYNIPFGTSWHEVKTWFMWFHWSVLTHQWLGCWNNSCMEKLLNPPTATEVLQILLGSEPWYLTTVHSLQTKSFSLCFSILWFYYFFSFEYSLVTPDKTKSLLDCFCTSTAFSPAWCFNFHTYC